MALAEGRSLIEAAGWANRAAALSVQRRAQAVVADACRNRRLGILETATARILGAIVHACVAMSAVPMHAHDGRGHGTQEPRRTAFLSRPAQKMLAKPRGLDYRQQKGFRLQIESIAPPFFVPLLPARRTLMTTLPLRRLSLVCWALFASCAGIAVGAVPQTAPPAGLRENTPTVHALVGARIVVAPGKVIEKGNLIIRDGIITAVGADAAVPSHARVWPMNGRTLYAGFIDSASEVPAAAPVHNEAGHYWNDQIVPEVRAEELYHADKKANEKFRSQGIAVRLVHPASSIIHGTSAR